MALEKGLVGYAWRCEDLKEFANPRAARLPTLVCWNYLGIGRFDGGGSIRSDVWLGKGADSEPGSENRQAVVVVVRVIDSLVARA